MGCWRMANLLFSQIFLNIPRKWRKMDWQWIWSKEHQSEWDVQWLTAECGARSTNQNEVWNDWQLNVEQGAPIRMRCEMIDSWMWSKEHQSEWGVQWLTAECGARSTNQNEVWNDWQLNVEQGAPIRMRCAMIDSWMWSKEHQSEWGVKWLTAKCPARSTNQNEVWNDWQLNVEQGAPIRMRCAMIDSWMWSKEHQSEWGVKWLTAECGARSTNQNEVCNDWQLNVEQGAPIRMRCEMVDSWMWSKEHQSEWGVKWLTAECGARSTNQNEVWNYWQLNVEQGAPIRMRCAMIVSWMWGGD